MSSHGGAGEVTRLLGELREGRRDAHHELIPLVQDELQRIAGALMKGERQGHSLQPTALVNEAWLRLVGDASPDWQNRRQFLAIAAVAMRRVLVEHARARGRDKRGGGWRRVTLGSPQGQLVSPAADVEILALHQALERLQAIHERQARVIELRWFGGLTLDEVAEELEVSDWTVKQDWAVGRAWLESELTRGHAAGDS
ncbi:MAG: sigma-70 family RNA polymerase sigma factor [Acidobacteriota bacterium]